MGKNQYQQNIEVLEKKGKLYKFISLILIILIAVIFVAQWKRDNGSYPFFKRHNSAPYTQQVEKIIDGLQYSGLVRFESRDVYLSLDFENGTWRLHNIHRFDERGNIVLEEGRYGTCGEMAAYAYEKIYPIFSKQYDIKFVRAAQSGYFLTPKASHVVLSISKKRGILTKGDITYILDPSFHKYGPIDEFEDYMFLEEMDMPPFVVNKDKDVVRMVSESVPILIEKESLLSFTVEKNYGKFDKQNFIVALTMTKKYRYAGRYLFAIRNNNGIAETHMNKHLGISEEVYKQLREKVEFMFDNILKQQK